MYTLLLTENNELVTTVKERIMQRSKLVDTLHFLVDPMYKGISMSDFTVMMEYLTPVSREYRTEILVKSDELYKQMLEYKLPFDTQLTREAGRIEVQLTFVKVGLDANGNSTQQVRKTSKSTIDIIPISAWSNIIPDSALTALDQRLIMVDAMLNAANEMTQELYETKADNVTYDKETQCLQLTANGKPIGDKILLEISNKNDSVCVKFIEVDENGNLIVVYSNGETENVGKTVGDAITGIYVPDVSADGIMTMTLSKNVGDEKYSWDINPFNDWHEIDGVENSSIYVWEKM